MGLFSGIKKLAKKTLGFVKDWNKKMWINPLKNVWNNLTGKTAAENMARTQEEQLRIQGEQAKLKAANEVDNVVKFEDTADPVLSDTRRKKRPTGNFASGLGLQI